MSRQIPTNLEKCCTRIQDFCMSLSHEAFVNFSHLLIVAAIRHDAFPAMLKVCNASHSGLLTSSPKEEKKNREYHLVSIAALMKSFIDPRFYSSEEEMEDKYDSILYMPSFVEALLEHINDYSAQEHLQEHRDFERKRQYPFVQMYETIE